jgi:AAA family ATP:ADP antiporter
MSTIKAIWRGLFDVRSGEAVRTSYMALYLLFVMVAYYILKPVSAAMFLNKLPVKHLPYLYILCAIAGGFVTHFYTRIALKASLQVAVAWAMSLAVACLIVLWWAVGPGRPWMLYVFNVWVSLFSIVLVSQGWLVAANIFDSRQAKRLYGLLGLGAVLGGLLGSAVTSFAARSLGSRNLILVSAVMVACAYGAFRLAASHAAADLSRARGAREQTRFSSRDLFRSIGANRHLEIIIAVILLTFVVDELVDFQFLAMAQRFYRGELLTAFQARYYLYLNSACLLLQFLFTAWIVRRAGVGGMLQIGPITLGVFSLGSVVAPGIVTAVLTRFMENLNRYTFNRTAMELLFLPLPAELRNRTKAFVDIFVDRSGRGLAGVALASLLALGIRDPRVFAMLTILCAIVWLLLARRAHREYLRIVRDRLQRRRLDLEGAHITVSDPETIAMLEAVTLRGTARQACFALDLLSDTPGYEVSPLLLTLKTSPLDQVREKVFEIAAALREVDLTLEALDEVSREGKALNAAVAYLLEASPKAQIHAAEFLSSGSHALAEAAVEAMAQKPAIAAAVITEEWLEAYLRSPDPEARALAAGAWGVRPECALAGMRSPLRALLEDQDPTVAAAACRAAGARKERDCVEAILRRMPEPRIRSAAIESLVAYGNNIIGVLADSLIDEHTPVTVRRRIPRVLQRVVDQRSVDVLLRSLNQLQDVAVRAASLKALSRLRETAPHLEFGETFVTEQILAEARHYFELSAALDPLRPHAAPHTATSLLVRTIEDRLKQTIERLFNLLGLRYPLQEIQAAHSAVQTRRKEEFQAAVEFLDNVLDRPLKRVLVPLLDASDRLTEHGKSLFGVEVRDDETTLRDLILNGDTWLCACAMATAAERKLHRLAPEIVRVSRQMHGEVAEVARVAAAGLV